MGVLARCAELSILDHPRNNSSSNHNASGHSAGAAPGAALLGRGASGALSGGWDSPTASALDPHANHSWTSDPLASGQPPSPHPTAAPPAASNSAAGSFVVGSVLQPPQGALPALPEEASMSGTEQSSSLGGAPMALRAPHGSARSGGSGGGARTSSGGGAHVVLDRDTLARHDAQQLLATPHAHPRPHPDAHAAALAEHEEMLQMMELASTSSCSSIEVRCKCAWCTHAILLSPA